MSNIARNLSNRFPLFSRRCHVCKKIDSYGVLAEEKTVCPHRKLFIHETCAVELKECEECDKSRVYIPVDSSKRSFPLLRRRRKKQKPNCCKRARNKCLSLLIFLTLISLSGYFVPRYWFVYIYQKPPPPFSLFDFITGEVLAFIVGCFVMLTLWCFNQIYECWCEVCCSCCDKEEDEWEEIDEE